MKNVVPKNILLVDDEQRFLAVLAEELRVFNNGYRILTAENGDRALKVLESAPVDLLVTDLRMPVMDGYELLSHMKNRYPNIPIIVMSTFLYSEVAERLRALGVSQCIEKPLSVSALEEMIVKTWQAV